MQITIHRYNIALGMYEISVGHLLCWYDPHYTAFDEHGAIMWYGVPNMVDIAATMNFPMNDIWHAQVDFYEERLAG
jgi:hypothetical protein